MRTISLSLLLCAALLMAGCSAGKDYVKPHIAIPQAFKGWKIATPNDAKIGDKWWQEYNDALLDSYMQAVNVSNQTLAKNAAAYKYALALIEATKAEAMPTLGAGLSASSSHSAQSSVTKTTKSVDASLQASWMPDIWGEVKRAVEANEANAEAAKTDLEAARLSIQVLLAQSYFQLRGLDAQSILLSKILKDYTASLTIIQNQYNAGIVVKTDVLTAAGAVKAVRAQISELEITRAQLEHSIAVLIGKNPSEFSIAQKVLPLQDTSRVSALDIPSLLPSELLERRPDIASAERRMKAANAQIGVADAAWFPQLGLSASVGAQANTLANLISTPNLVWALGGSLSQAIFDGGIREANKKQAMANYDESVANYKQTVLVAFREVEDSLSTLKSLKDESDIQKEKLKLSTEMFNISKNQYNAGIVNELNIISAEADLFNDMLLEIELQSRLKVAHASLIGGLGGGWNSSEHP
ncbi:MAG: efflux transporter outer membrane subunit [Thiovulaceae bacterium]|nr:efflux transporter outer membrane subunit [Sulfurimonadaceae bacterium]